MAANPSGGDANICSHASRKEDQPEAGTTHAAASAGRSSTGSQSDSPSREPPLRAPRANRVRSVQRRAHAWLSLVLQALCGRSGHPAEAKAEADVGGGSRRLLCGVRLCTLHCQPRVPSCGPADQIISHVGEDRQVHRGIPSGNEEVRPRVRQLPRRDRGGDDRESAGGRYLRGLGRSTRSIRKARCLSVRGRGEGSPSVPAAALPPHPYPCRRKAFSLERPMHPAFRLSPFLPVLPGVSVPRLHGDHHTTRSGASVCPGSPW